MKLKPPESAEQKVIDKPIVDSAKMTAAKQKDALMALLAAHPGVREKLGL